MMVNCTHTRMADVVEMVEHPQNANTHSDQQIQLLAKILKYQGWRHPIVVSKRSGFIVAGHARLAAAKLNGWAEVPIDEQEFENDAAEIAFLVSDNTLSELSKTDLSIVNDLVGDLGPDFDLELLGIPDFTIDVAEKFEPQSDEDDVPENVDTRVKPGDIWQLGRHRLMCGDSTNIQHVEALMAGEKADMVFTDPPYGMFLDTDFSSMQNRLGTVKGVHGGNKYQPVIGDNEDFSPDLINTVFACFPNAREIFLWGADYYAEHLPNRNSGSWIIWDKRCDESADRMFGSVFETCWSRSRHKREIARIKSGLFGVKDDSKKRVHPTQKPVQLIEWFFERWGKATDVVADLFGGSGSTLVACEKTNRKCFMMELDPKYCDVILTRWEKYTGQKAELTNG